MPDRTQPGSDLPGEESHIGHKKTAERGLGGEDKWAITNMTTDWQTIQDHRSLGDRWRDPAGVLTVRKMNCGGVCEAMQSGVIYWVSSTEVCSTSVDLLHATFSTHLHRWQRLAWGGGWRLSWLCLSLWRWQLVCPRAPSESGECWGHVKDGSWAEGGALPSKCSVNWKEKGVRR